MDRDTHSGNPRQVVILVLPQVHLLDLAGPVQVLWEANDFGAAYRLQYCGLQEEAQTAQRLSLSNLEPLPTVQPGMLVMVPGLDSRFLDDLDHVPVAWLREAQRAGATISSICSGAFVLAHAGVLDGRSCTTHWKVADKLQSTYPRTRVLKNRLFVRSEGVITSAGVASGIDMALSLVEEEHGPLMAARVAREIVVYLRRDGQTEQDSIYLQYRTHLHPGVHRAQDWLISHPDSRPTLEQLAEVARMSPRNLTRVFKEATGVTLKTYANRLKLEIAQNLFHDPNQSVEDVASQCGFQDSRQLRRLWKRRFGVVPSTWKRQEEERRTVE